MDNVQSRRFGKLELTKHKENIKNVNRKLLFIILLTISTILTTALVLSHQETQIQASVGSRKIALGINNGQANVDRPLEWIKNDVERIKTDTGAYPAVYVLWSNLESHNPNLDVLNYLDSKNITPVISLMPWGGGSMDTFLRQDGRFILSASSNTDGVGSGGIKFDNQNPSLITKIYVSKQSSGTEDPSRTLAPTWKNGEKIEIIGSDSTNSVDYESKNYFKFKILSLTDTPTYWILAVRPERTTPLQNYFAPNKPVFITPSTYNVKKFSNAAIAGGSMNDKFGAIAEIARQFNKPIIFRYAQEMNADFYSWQDAHKATKEKKGFHRYKFHDIGNTEGSFIKSWVTMHNTINTIAPNVLFFWNPTNRDTDRYASYYPGERYVDYVGYDAYSGTGNFPHNGLLEISKAAMSKLNSLPGENKPIIIGETGINSLQANGVSGSFPDYRKKWLTNGYNDLYSQYPKLKAILYFDVDMSGPQSSNWLMSSEPEITSAYRALLLDPRFQGKLGQQSFPPSPSSTPTPAEGLPFGFHDSASCTVTTGWACDENDYSKPISVELYDGPKSEGIRIGSVIADKPRELGVATECGGVSDHGFSFTIPEGMKNGISHEIYAYAVDDLDPNVTSRLSSSPKIISCAGADTTPIPEPTEIVSCISTKPTITYLDTSKSGRRGSTVVYRISITDNDSSECGVRRLVFDLTAPTARWSYSPEVVKINPGANKIVDFKVTSGKYTAPGVKSLMLNVHKAKKPYNIFSQNLEYIVTE